MSLSISSPTYEKYKAELRQNQTISAVVYRNDLVGCVSIQVAIVLFVLMPFILIVLWTRIIIRVGSDLQQSIVPGSYCRCRFSPAQVW